MRQVENWEIGCPTGTYFLSFPQEYGRLSYDNNVSLVDTIRRGALIASALSAVIEESVSVTVKLRIGNEPEPGDFPLTMGADDLPATVDVNSWYPADNEEADR